MSKIKVSDILKKHGDKPDVKGDPLITIRKGLLTAAIKEIVDTVLDKGIDAGLALSTMTDEPFTSDIFKILRKGVSDGIKKGEVDYE